MKGYMTKCECVILSIIEAAGYGENISAIALMAHVSDRHARRCLTSHTMHLIDEVIKINTPGRPARIILRKRKDNL